MRQLAPSFYDFGRFTPTSLTPDGVRDELKRRLQRFGLCISSSRPTALNDIREPSYNAAHATFWHHDHRPWMAVWVDHWPTQVTPKPKKPYPNTKPRRRMPANALRGLRGGHIYVWDDSLYVHRTPPSHASGRWFVRFYLFVPVGGSLCPSPSPSRSTNNNCASQRTITSRSRSA